jgi:hypothetical protein
MVLIAPFDGAVFRVVVEADDFMAGFEQLLHQVAGDEAGGPRDEDLQIEGSF